MATVVSLQLVRVGIINAQELLSTPRETGDTALGSGNLFECLLPVGIFYYNVKVHLYRIIEKILV